MFTSMADIKLRTLVQAALSYHLSDLHHYDHPDNPNGDAEMEYKQDNLDHAVTQYVLANPELMKNVAGQILEILKSGLDVHERVENRKKEMFSVNVDELKDEDDRNELRGPITDV